MCDLITLIRYYWEPRQRRILDIQRAGNAIVTVSTTAIASVYPLYLAFIVFTVVNATLLGSMYYIWLTACMINFIALILVATSTLVMVRRNKMLLITGRFGLVLRIMMAVQLINIVMSILLIMSGVIIIYYFIV